MNEFLGHFQLDRLFRAERHFLFFKDQLAESRRQKTKENIIPRVKLRLVKNGPKGYTSHLTISMRGQHAIGKIQRNNYYHRELPS